MHCWVHFSPTCGTAGRRLVNGGGDVLRQPRGEAVLQQQQWHVLRCCKCRSEGTDRGHVQEPSAHSDLEAPGAWGQ
jgi:hypothetical protein